MNVTVEQAVSFILSFILSTGLLGVCMFIFNNIQYL